MSVLKRSGVGGRRVGLYTHTVGPAGANFTSLSAAAAAGISEVLVIGDTTEPANVVVPSTGMHVSLLAGVTVDMNGFAITIADQYNLTIDGPRSAVLRWAFGSSTVLVQASSALALITVRGITLRNQSTIALCYFTNATHDISNIQIETPNHGICGFRYATANNLFSDIIYVSPGTNAHRLFEENPTGSAIIRRLTLTGTFGRGSGVGTVNMIHGNSVLDGVIVNGANSPELVVSGVVKNIVTLANDTDILVSNDDTIIEGANLGGGYLDFDGYDNCSFNDIITTGYIDPKGGSTGNRVSNSFFGSFLVAFTGTNNKMSNCNVLAGFQVIGDDNSLDMVTVGDYDPGEGGAETITIDISSDRTMISNCRTAAAIVDNSVSSHLSNNNAYG